MWNEIIKQFMAFLIALLTLLGTGWIAPETAAGDPIQDQLPAWWWGGEEEGVYQSNLVPGVNPLNWYAHTYMRWGMDVHWRNWPAVEGPVYVELVMYVAYRNPGGPSNYRPPDWGYGWQWWYPDGEPECEMEFYANIPLWDNPNVHRAAFYEFEGWIEFDPEEPPHYRFDVLLPPYGTCWNSYYSQAAFRIREEGGPPIHKPVMAMPATMPQE